MYLCVWFKIVYFVLFWLGYILFEFDICEMEIRDSNGEKV